jgi:hypothetical protein
MITVHELAHIKEKAHDKAFYQLCTHMEPQYHQYEFDLRVYLTHLDEVGKLAWPGVRPRPCTGKINDCPAACYQFNSYQPRWLLG